VTTLREDVETFGRKATVRFGRDWRADAERRDFTMNALSVTRDGAVYDYVGGLVDLAARRVRFIGDAATRIAEDYLRILRFFRFHASYGHDDPDPVGLAACIAGREGLAQLSRERVRMEVEKLMVAPGVVATLRSMEGAGLLLPVLAGVPLVADCAAMAAIEAAHAWPADPVRRLGALAVLVEEDAERLREKLRLANSEHDRLLSMASGWRRVTPAAGEQDARTLLYRLGPVRFSDRVLLAWARSGAEPGDAAWRALATLPTRWSPPVFPIRAADFMARNVPRGPALGAAMRAAEGAWIAAGFPLDRAALAALVEDAAKAVEDGKA
jgi:tRNA nucleotidyltransferase/poly(A) polymerase